MKIKILKSNNKITWYSNMINQVIDVKYDMKYQRRCFTGNDGVHNLYNDDIVITELPESFCVKRCDDIEKWKKYIQWLNKTYDMQLLGSVSRYYYGVVTEILFCDNEDFGTEIHIDDMIKHIDYMERHIKGGEQFHKESQLTVKMDKKEINKYIEDNFKGGTIFIGFDGNKYIIPDEHDFDYVSYEYLDVIKLKVRLYHKDCKCETSMVDVWKLDKGFVEIVKEEINMNTQKLSRQGLKEIHSVACSSWKETLEQFGRRNPLEDYIELSQEEINIMFDACTKEQLPIVSKYLKKGDGSVDVMKFKCEIYDKDGRAVIEKRCDGEYAHKSLLLEDVYDWEIKKDSKGKLCLIPTKKK